MVATAPLRQAVELWRSLKSEIYQSLMCWNSSKSKWYLPSIKHHSYVLWQPPLDWLILISMDILVNKIVWVVPSLLFTTIWDVGIGKKFLLNGITVPIVELIGAWEGCLKRMAMQEIYWGTLGAERGRLKISEYHTFPEKISGQPTTWLLEVLSTWITCHLSYVSLYWRIVICQWCSKTRGVP